MMNTVYKDAGGLPQNHWSTEIWIQKIIPIDFTIVVCAINILSTEFFNEAGLSIIYIYNIY